MHDDHVGRPRPASVPRETSPATDPQIRDFATEGLEAGWQFVRWPDGHVSETYSAARVLPNTSEVTEELERRSLRSIALTRLARLGRPRVAR